MHLKEEIGKLTKAIQDKKEKSLEMKMKEINLILEIQDLKTNVSTKSSEAAVTEPETFLCDVC